MTTHLLFLHALSPLHAGTGESNGAIELAIARERGTNFPYLPGSSLKGSLRDRARGLARDGALPAKAEDALFGPPTKNASDHAGSLLFGDANLLLLPVRSIAGTFAWATSPYLLQRFARDANEAGQAAPKVPSVADVGHCLVHGKTALMVGGAKVIFEDLDFKVRPSNELTAWVTWLAERLFPGADNQPWREMLAKRLCVVHDDAMGFLSQHATDVVTRIALEPDTKTVKQGALWHEENLPTESVLVSLIEVVPASKALKEAGLTAPELVDALGTLTRGSVQLGGHATVGRGRCRMVLAQPASAARGGAR